MGAGGTVGPGREAITLWVPQEKLTARPLSFLDLDCPATSQMHASWKPEHRLALLPSSSLPVSHVADASPAVGSLGLSPPPPKAPLLSNDKQISDVSLLIYIFINSSWEKFVRVIKHDGAPRVQWFKTVVNIWNSFFRCSFMRNSIQKANKEGASA